MFGDWTKSTDWMRNSQEFKANPIGVFVNPEQIAADLRYAADVHALSARISAAAAATPSRACSKTPVMLKKPWIRPS